jgi:excisionase family DNA binding protein
MHEPPVTATESELPALQGLSLSLSDAASVSILLDEGDPLPLPDSVREGLERIIQSLASGLSVVVDAHEEWLTTQEAADFLGVSRPYLIRLVERESIEAQRLPGERAHRRISLRGLTAFRDREVIQAEIEGDHEEPEIARSHERAMTAGSDREI